MRLVTIAAIFGTLFASSPVQANECVTTQSDLVNLVDQVSKSTGRKFVLDPRVQARVTLSGVEAGELDYQTLRSVLAVHGFAAIESGGMTYVVHETVEASMRVKLGVATTGE